MRVSDLQGMSIGIILVAFLIGITVAIFYFKNLQDTMKEVEIGNRQIPPSNVWLMLIPIFGTIYQFIAYPKISESLKREFEQRGHAQQGDYGKNLGLAQAILSIASMIISFLSIVSLVVMIIYWVKMVNYKKMLRSIPEGGGDVRISSNQDLLD